MACKSFRCRISISLLLMLFILPAAAQEKIRITGSVTDAETGKGIGFATVSLADSTQKAVAAWTCDGNGKFDYTAKIQGEFTATVSAMGYAAQQRKVTLAAPRTDLEPFALKPGTQLDGITVTTVRPLVRNEADKIAYSVDADPETPSSSVLDILRKVPLVTVDAEDNVRVQGQTNFKVLINGKSSSLMDRNFKEVARGMPAASVKDIEVITSPSSKYEAEGVGGIINIVTDRKRLSGYNGSVGLSGDSNGGYGGNGYLSAQFGKLTLSANGGYMKGKHPESSFESSSENRLSDDARYLSSSGKNKNSYNYGYYNLEASYEIDTFNLVTLALWGHGGEYNYNSSGRTLQTDAGFNPVMAYNSVGSGGGNYGGLSGNIDYQRIFRKPEKTLTFSYKLDNSPGGSHYENTLERLLNYTEPDRRSDNDTWSREQTLQIDYVDPITKMHSIEAGAKFILRQNGNDPMTYSRPDDTQPWVYDQARKNALDYDQYILGIYGTYALKYKKFTGKAGIRGETTWNDGVFTTAVSRTPMSNTLFNPIPYVNLSYAPKPGARYSLSYTQRLSRPGIWYLNPYVDDSNPMSIRHGNPDLKSEISHTFNASYGRFGPKVNFTIGPNVSITDNSIEQVIFVHENGVVESTYANVGKRNFYGLNLYGSYRTASGKFSVSVNGAGRYVDISDQAGNGNSGFAGDLNFNGMASVWKNASVFVNGFWSSPRIMLQGEGAGYYYYSIGINQKLLKKKLTLSLSATNLFNRYVNFWQQYDTPSLYQRSDFKNQMRNFRLGLSYNFGKAQVQVKKARRGIQNDDVKAGGSGGGAGGGTGQ